MADLPSALEMAEIVIAAEGRLDWLLEEYGPDDIDYATFSPLLELATELARALGASASRLREV